MAKLIKNKKVIFCLIVLGILTTSSAVLALQVEWPDSPGIPNGTSLDPNSELPQLIRYLYEWGIALGGLAVFVVLVYAGFQYLTSAGSPAQMTEAAERIKSAVIGLVLLLGSVLILNTINPELTTFKPLVIPAPGDILGNCEFYYEIDPETGERKEPPIQREDPQQYCQDNFGDGYECKNNICTIDMAKLFEIVDCKSVFINSAEGEIILGGTIDTIELDPGEGFGLQANPPGEEKQCMANLILYENVSNWPWGGCTGDKRTLAVQPGTAGYNDFKFVEGTDMSVRCIKLEKI